MFISLLYKIKEPLLCEIWCHTSRDHLLKSCLEALQNAQCEAEDISEETLGWADS